MDELYFQLWVTAFANTGLQLTRHTEVRDGVEVELYMLYGGGETAFEFGGTDEDVEVFLRAVLDVRERLQKFDELRKRAKRQ